jgi:hypothetical protein
MRTPDYIAFSVLFVLVAAYFLECQLLYDLFERVHSIAQYG